MILTQTRIKESIEPLTTEFKTDNLAILKFHSFEKMAIMKPTGKLRKRN